MIETVEAKVKIKTTRIR